MPHRFCTPIVNEIVPPYRLARESAALPGPSRGERVLGAGSSAGSRTADRLSAPPEAKLRRSEAAVSDAEPL
jgi:hypothetical protein